MAEQDNRQTEAGVVQLDAFRKDKKPAGIMIKYCFPEIYRLEGYAEITPQKKSKSIIKLPKLLRRFPAYTFDDINPHGFVNPKWTQVTKLDPKVDDGWVVVRHHHDDSHIEGFLESQIDHFFDRGDAEATSQIMSTEHGIFSLTHRARADGAPNHLLVLVLSPDSGKQLSLQERIQKPNEYHIYHPDGSVTHDHHLLYPFLKPTT